MRAPGTAQPGWRATATAGGLILGGGALLLQTLRGGDAGVPQTATATSQPRPPPWPPPPSSGLAAPRIQPPAAAGVPRVAGCSAPGAAAPQLAPAERARCGAAGRWEILPAEHLAADGQWPAAGLDCSLLFSRWSLSGGGAVDAFDPEAAAAPPWAPLGALGAAQCEPQARRRSCRACGYSCNAFGYQHWSSALALPELRYPLRAAPAALTVRPPKVLGKKLTKRQMKQVVCGRCGNCFTRCGSTVDQDDMHHYGKGYVYKRPTVEVHGASSDVVLTLRRFGYHAVAGGRHRNDSECAVVVEEPTVVLPVPEWAVQPRRNVAHWIHDIFVPTFTTLDAHFGPLGADALGVRVAVHEPLRNIVPFVQGSGADWLLQRLVGPMERIVDLGVVGTCLRRAVADCPPAGSMGPTPALQRWLTLAGHSGFARLPLPPPAPGGGPGRLRLAVVLRRLGSSRALVDPDALIAAAELEGWRVEVALPGGALVNSPPALKVLVGALQRTHLLAGMHGSELAPMLFLPNGSAVVEIIDGRFQWIDPWYINQAISSGLTLFRWRPPGECIVWGNLSKAGIAGSLAEKLGQRAVPGTWWRDHVSAWQPPVGEWVELLAAVRRRLAAW
eukprot:TRINITY_DN26852_c0_g1_i1.p1 TRINITY_DN26852_c0_g1~~TRINITY_DN26852_c0_g1_i1.p1  ORF type:complete len:637 (+),score=169.36 TRINITY_DN26852_c0_g1_i1:68-1912(+)